jgi:hypothetical protein
VAQPLIRLLAVWIIFAAAPLLADIAPTQHVGYGISPVKANGLRMLSAQVDITWGTPCSLSAIFVIDNQTSKAADIQLGFPIQRVYSERLKDYTHDELTFAFDGVPVLPPSIAINDPITQKLKTFRIKTVHVDNWDDARLVQYLNDESKELDPEHKGVKFVLRIPADKTEMAKARGKQSFGMEGGNFPELLSLAEFKYSIEGDTVYLEYATRGDNTNDPDEYTWYRCQHTFPPGHTKVSVTTKFPASLTYSWPYRERILYCIETGGSWEGTIGSEEVDIHFPNPVASGQIYDANPKDYTVDGSTVRWLFKDFKPQGKDHDIDIEYLRPDVVAAIANARAELARDPSDPRRIIRLAKDLFSLGPYKGDAPYAPGKLSLKELNDLLAQMHNDQDREWFQYFYSPNKNGEYELPDNQWDKIAPPILRILNSIDYQPTYGRSPEVKEAQALIERLLQDHPDNAEAWNVYFANYHRFRFAGGGEQAGGTVYYPHEIEQISKALHRCPNDSCLQLWFKVITGNYTGPNDTRHDQDQITLRDQIKKQGFLDNDFQNIDYDHG